MYVSIKMKTAGYSIFGTHVNSRAATVVCSGATTMKYHSSGFPSDMHTNQYCYYVTVSYRFVSMSEDGLSMCLSEMRLSGVDQPASHTHAQPIKCPESVHGAIDCPDMNWSLSKLFFAHY